MTGHDTLAMFVVYDHPTDHPAHFVVRKWLVRGDELIPSGWYFLAPSLSAARGYIDEFAEKVCEPSELRVSGLTCLTEPSGGDPNIVETWL